MSDKMNDLCRPNYEAEYERLNEICKKQEMELREFREEFCCVEQENRELRAKLDMVYLIFGGRNT